MECVHFWALIAANHLDPVLSIRGDRHRTQQAYTCITGRGQMRRFAACKWSSRRLRSSSLYSHLNSEQIIVERSIYPSVCTGNVLRHLTRSRPKLFYFENCLPQNIFVGKTTSGTSLQLPGWTMDFYTWLITWMNSFWIWLIRYPRWKFTIICFWCFSQWKW